MHNIYQPDQTAYLKAKQLLEQDELVVFPTETIYGLGANALSDTAAKRIFQLKGRPSDNPLIVHLGHKEQISEYAFIENEIQQTIIDTLMPWPVTLLLKKKSLISPIVCPVEYVGIRLPSNQIAQDFLKTVGLPIAAPSANLSGKPSPTNAKMVYDNLWNQVPMIIDGGESEAGIESTVIRVTPLSAGRQYKIQILRPGFVTKEDIEELFHHEITVEYTTHNPELSPGMRYKHYSIDGKVVLIPPFMKEGQEGSETPPYEGGKGGSNIKHYIDYEPSLKQLARDLRNGMTQAEKNLRYHFLSKCEYKFQRQKPIDWYIVDFFCNELKLIIEIDGDSHFTDEAIKYDAERTKVLERLGFQVMRFTNEEVFHHFEEVCKKIIDHRTSPTPPSKGGRYGYLITQEFFDIHQTFFSDLEQQNVFIKIRGTHKNLATCAHNLFDCYHYFDQEKVDILYVERLPEIWIGYAIMNRVKRSAE